MAGPLEKLGAFYLGREFDAEQGQPLAEPVMYDARDLTTHGVCVGMTGSGKTGLCIDLLEEAALDAVPAIIIDPKGDITNLLLTFPELKPTDFEPWVNLDDARRKGMTPPEYAKEIAQTWRKGLADWDQGPDRIRRLQDSAEFRIYTPGSDTGHPVSILASLQAPALDWDDHQESLRERIQGTVSALLGLVGIDADPLRSREHILLCSLFEHFWRNSEDLDLARLITSLQNPPVRQLGVFDVDTFFPADDRFELAMSLNNILAAPGFASWLKGDPLDVARLLHTPDGKPRHSIFYIAHLSDEERMFFVTLLLEQILTWVRHQSGTTSLRALLYFDEVMGFLPPVANPPAKRPLLTLLKQARAFGLGVLLTTQNPVDLDYKGLSNTGTWFIGKLQTERDKQRVLEGLAAATTQTGEGLQRKTLDRLITGLGSRVFLLHNVHESEPVLFHTRWAMSYLRGPLTRSQIKLLKQVTTIGPATSPAKPVAPAPTGPSAVTTTPTLTAATSEPAEDYAEVPPTLAPGTEQVFLPVQCSVNRACARLEEKSGECPTVQSTRLVYESHLALLGRVSFLDRRRKVNETRTVGRLVRPEDMGTVIRWPAVTPLALQADRLPQAAEPAAHFGFLAPEFNNAKDIKAITKDFSDHLYHDERFELLSCPALKLTSEPGESEGDFRIRLQQAARELRDAEVDKLRRKSRRSLDRLATRLDREKRELEKDKSEYSARKQEELISAGETLIGMLGIFGRKQRSGFSSAARKRRMTSSAKADIDESAAEIARLTTELEKLRGQIEEDAAAIAEKWEAAVAELETVTIKPRRSDVRIDLAALAWAPYWEILVRSRTGESARHRVPAWVTGQFD